MNNAGIKTWSKEKIKGKIWELLIPIVVASILSSLTVGQQIVQTENGISVEGGTNLGIFFYFVQVGLAYFMVKFINDQEHNFKDLFYFSKDYIRIFLVNLLQTLFIFLWTLLLIVPGIIKAIGYALVPLLLADDKYKNLGYKDLLKKSEEMMNGHKMDYFTLSLSFIGWFLLIIPTFGFILIWLAPYYTTARMKFLNDLKTSQEGNMPSPTIPEQNNVQFANTQTTTEQPEILSTGNSQPEEKKFCTNCGAEITPGNAFCSNCGQRLQ